MRVVIALLILFTVYLQYALWYQRGGLHDVDKLRAAVATQRAEIERLRDRNQALAAEVADLKQGLDAIEERARSEMGMIREGEVFFRMADPGDSGDPEDPATPPDAAVE